MMTSDPSKTRISIAYLINNLGHGGGTENHLHTLVSHLDSTKFDPIVIALGPRFPDFNLTAPCEIVHLNWSHLVHWRSFRPFFRLMGILRARRVCILQLFFPDSRVIGVFAALFARVPNVVVARRDCHGAPGWMDRMILLITSQLSDYCLTNSKAGKTLVLQQERFTADRITVIPNSIVDINQGLLNSSRNGAASRVVVGMVANLRPVKRIDRFLRMAQDLSEEVDRFQVVGFGWDDQRQKHQNYARELGISEKVDFSFTLTDVASYLRGFAVGVLTSEAEGLSNALIEYAMCGLPAVAFDVGGNGEVILHGRTGFLVPPGREDVLRYYVRLLVHSPELRERMGNRARERALSEFSIDRMIRQTETFYQEIVQR